MIMRRRPMPRLQTFTAVVDLTPADTPEPEVPADPEALSACGVLYLALDRWHTAGGDTPFSWRQLRDRAVAAAGDGAGSVALRLAKQLMGQAWTKTYGSTDPDAAGIVFQEQRYGISETRRHAQARARHLSV